MYYQKKESKVKKVDYAGLALVLTGILVLCAIVAAIIHFTVH